MIKYLILVSTMIFSLTVHAEDTELNNPFLNGTTNTSQSATTIATTSNNTAAITPTQNTSIVTSTYKKVKAKQSNSIKKEQYTSSTCKDLPKTCKAMTNCEQAKKALNCGNTQLDRDHDGIPCERICQR